jgi:hypothetical protein
MLDPACRSDWRSSPPAVKCALCIGHSVRSQAVMGVKVPWRKRFCAALNHRRPYELRPGVFAHVESFREVVALAAQNLRRSILESLADPFAACCTQPVLTLRAPSVWPSIVRVFRRPKEANTPPGDQTINDMLTHHGLLLETMDFAQDGFHRTLLLHGIRRLHAFGANDADSVV